MSREPPLYVSDGQIAKILGLEERTWREIAAVLTRSGLPRHDPLFGGLRYWPAVRAFLDRRYGLGASSVPRHPDGEENLDAIEHPRARSKTKAA